MSEVLAKQRSWLKFHFEFSLDLRLIQKTARLFMGPNESFHFSAQVGISAAGLVEESGPIAWLSF